MLYRKLRWILAAVCATAVVTGCEDDNTTSGPPAPAPVPPPSSWSRVTSPSPGDFNGVHFVSDDVGWAVGDNGAIFRTLDGGQSWQNQRIPSMVDDLNDVFVFPDGTGWAVGDRGRIITTSDSGQSWTTQGSGTAVSLQGVHFIDTETGIAVGSNRTIRRTDNGGVIWRSVEVYDKRVPAESPDLYDVYMANELVGFAVGANAGTYRTSDGGHVWVKKSERLRMIFQGARPTLFGVACFQSSFCWAVGTDGTIVYTSDAGFTWNTQASGVSEDLKSIDIFNGSSGWAAGGRRWTYTGNGGAFWTAGNFPDSAMVNSITFQPGGVEGFAAGTNGALLRAR